MKRIWFIWDIIQRTSKRHWLFTVIGIIWILSPLDDFLLPVVDEVIIVLLWAWAAFKESKRRKAIKQLPTK